MYELIRISKRAHYISCPSRVGIVEIGDGAVCLIDAGSDRDTAKRVLRHIRENMITANSKTNSETDGLKLNLIFFILIYLKQLMQYPFTFMAAVSEY